MGFFDKLFGRNRASANAPLRQALDLPIAAEDFPVSQSFAVVRGIVTYESHFANGLPADLEADVTFLSSVDWGECAYGAASNAVHPFALELSAEDSFRTGSDVLRALGATSFRSAHIASLDADRIPFPGYRPGTPNDEIHDDDLEQHIFQRPPRPRREETRDRELEDERGEDDEEDAFEAEEDEEEDEDVNQQSLVNHQRLREHVEGGHLWYVLLHTRPKRHGEFMLSEYVFLFALGKSLRSRHAIGVFTHQVCHNLCD